MQAFPLSQQAFLLTGPVGELEVITNQPDQPRNAVAIICHPHPLHSGTMNNKVVTTLARTFQDLNFKTVRFNFRGVGKSVGTYAEGIGETEDLLAIVHWVKSVCPDDDIWLAGFSFGAAVVARAATLIPIAGLVTVAPPVPRFHLKELPAITCPWIVVQGEEDEIVVPADVYTWIENLNPKPILIRMPDVGHFFHGQLLELRQQLQNVIMTFL